MYKALIFDLDGTLLNTSPDICKTVNASLAQFGCPPITLEQTIKFVGNGAKKLIERAVPDQFSQLTDKIYSLYLKLFAACDNSFTRLYDGEEQFLNRVSASGIKTAIVTNKPQDATEAVCAKLLSPFRFDFISGQTQKFALKPDPALTLSVVQSWGFSPRDCVFIGDGETDIMTAANAGMDCISVLWGYRPKKSLEEAGGRVFACDFAQLERLIFD